MGRVFGAGRLGIDRCFYPVDDVIVDAVFDVGRFIFRHEKLALVGFILSE